MKSAVFFVCLGACALYSLSAVFAQAPAPSRSVWDGVYTEEQAGRGEEQYAQFCEHCHASDLGGNIKEEIPALVWDAFMMQWDGRTVKDLYDRMRRSMPADDPGTLTPSEYADLVAYIFKSNKFPTGDRELGRDADLLQGIFIEKAPSR